MRKLQFKGTGFTILATTLDFGIDHTSPEGTAMVALRGWNIVSCSNLLKVMV
jgi:hypothetical protein